MKMNLKFMLLSLLVSNQIVFGFSLFFNEDKDVVSTGICSRLCKGGQVFSAFQPPKEPDCGSFISCKKCDYGAVVKKNDPSLVCSNVFSNEFVQSDYESQINLYYGKSQLIIPHNSTLSRLSEESNVLNKDKGRKMHGLFTVAVDWKMIKGADVSQCSNGVAEIEWSIFNIGVYRNWDFVAIIETKPEATFPFCFENVEIPLDITRSGKIGSSIPTRLKNLGYSVAGGMQSAVRITKTIAVNQKEMKINPKKALEILLKKYVSFKISINGASVKNIFSENFYESRKDESIDGSRTVGGSSSEKEESNQSYINSSGCSGNSSENCIKPQEKNNKLEALKEKLKDRLRGKGFTSPLILDSMMSLGFYSCFRVICTKNKSRIYQKRPELEKRIPLSIETARNIHTKALNQFSSLIPQGQTVPLPIYNSEYWVIDHSSPSIFNKRLLQNKDKTQSESKKSNQFFENKSYEEASMNIDDSEFSSYSDLLAILAITNSEIHNDCNTNKIIKTDSCLGLEQDN